MGEIEKELVLYQSSSFKLGEHIYMGMAKLKGRTVVISVAYKIDYCIVKANQFVELSDHSIHFYKVNKIRIGELEPEISFKV